MNRKHLLTIITILILLALSTTSIYAEIPDKNPYLLPELHIESDNQQIIKLAKSLTKFDKSEIDKVRSIQYWINDNITYDWDKYNKHMKGDYNQNYGAVNTYLTKKGVCYDYSCLFAALARSVGLETRLIKKYIYLDGDVVYHAWNEVMIDGNWVTIDVTE